MNRPPKTTKRERDLATVCGGRHITVQRTNGTTEKVFVRQLPLRLADAYIELKISGAEQATIELCIGRSAHWDKKWLNEHAADIYTVESQTRLLELADELNFPTALQQIERKKSTIGSLEPMLKRLYKAQADVTREAMEPMMKGLLASALSSLPASPSLAATTPKFGTTGASTSSSSPSSSTTPPAASTPSAPSTPPSTPPPPPGTAARQ